MGAIVAIIGEPGDPELPLRLDHMLARSPYRGEPDWHLEPGLALGVQTLGEDASLASVGRWTVAVHGFIGNWDELASDHGLELTVDADHASRLAIAYEHVGDSLFARLRGEFSILLYDNRDRRLRAVRDPLGLRPLFTQSHGGRCVLATEIRQVLAGSGAPPDIDPDGLVQDILWVYADRERTHVRGVSRPLPGRILAVRRSDGGRPRHLATTWRPPAQAGTDYDIDELAAELRGLLDQSLDRSLPGRPFALGLSGGIDSSTLWCLIADRARRGDPRAALGHPYSFVIPGLDCDESERIRLVHEATSTRGALVHGPDETLGATLDELARDVDGLHLGSLFLPRMIARAAEQDGRSAMLLGVGGDEFFFGSLAYLADVLRRGRLDRYVADLLRYRPTGGLRRRQLVVGYTVALAWRLLAQRLRRRPPPNRPTWLHRGRELPAVTDLEARLDDANGGPPANRSRRAALGALLSVQDLHQRDTEEQLFARHGLEQRLPLMDLDLVEFVFRIPGRSLSDGRRSKHLLRLSVQDLLPPVIRDGLAAVDYESAICRGLSAVGRSLPPRSWRLVELGIADPGGLTEMLEAAEQSESARSTLPSLIVAEALVRRST